MNVVMAVVVHLFFLSVIQQTDKYHGTNHADSTSYTTEWIVNIRACSFCNTMSASVRYKTVHLLQRNIESN